MSLAWPIPLRVLYLACAAYAVPAAFLSWTFTQSTGLSRWTLLPAGPQHTYLNLLAVNLATWLGWGLLAPLVFLAGRRVPFEKARWAGPLVTHAALSVALAALHGVFVATVRVGLQAAWGLQPQWAPSVLEHVLRNGDLHVPVYWGLLGLQHAVDYYRAAHARDLVTAQVQTRLVEARLLTLQRQVHPHFLFNTLHGISALVHANPDKADYMIERLSDMLRIALATSDRQVVPLREELGFLRAYLAIEEVNLGDRLRVRIDVDGAVEEARVPTLMLQLLVENAVRHGLSPRATGGTVVVSAEARGGTLFVRVSDDGVGVRPGVHGHGLGVANTRARLVALYGQAASLTMEPRAGGGTEVVVRVPLDLGRAASLLEHRAS